MRDLLAGAARYCPGLTEVLLVDAQGVLVESFVPAAGADPEAIGVEFHAAIPALARIATVARIGRPLEWLMAGERGTLLIRRIGRLELFLVLRVPADEWIGRARFAARLVSGRLLEELS